MMSDFVRFTKGLADKGKLIPSSDIFNYIESEEQDYYASAYLYNEKQVEEFKKTGSIRGIKDVVTNRIWFDFDQADDPTFSQIEAREVISRLEKYGINRNNIEVYFSGNKGFHLVVTLNRYITPDQVYGICVSKFGQGMKSLDTAVYDPSRIFRVPGTKHQKSGLFKIPLTHEQLKSLNINQIKKLASSLDNIKDEFEWEAASPSEDFFSLPKKEKLVPEVTNTELNFSQKPSQWKNCKWALLQGSFKEGERHNALMVIAATCRGLGYDKDTTYYMCKSALKKQAASTGKGEFSKEELYKNIIEQSIFTDNWEGGQYSCSKPGWLQNYCQSLGEKSCQHKTNEDPVVLEPSDLIKTFDDFVKNFDKNRIMTGLAPIDQNVNITIGQPIGILAAPSVGKTSLLLTILNNTSKQGLHSMFFSLDMYNVLVTQKLIQKFSNQKFEKLKDLVINNPQKAVEYYDVMQNEMKHMHTVVKSGVTVADMRQIILDYEKENNCKIKLVAVDYLELISGPYSDETANSSFNAKALRDLASDLNVCVVVLLQPQKTAEPDEPITSYRKIKGASMLEQSFRIVFSLYRPGFSCSNPEEDRYIGINCVKNTMGPLFSTHLGFDGFTGSVSELSEEEQEELQQLIQRKKNEKEAEKAGSGWA